MKIHISAERSLQRKAVHAAELLASLGHEVISRWLTSCAKLATIAENAQYALNDVLLADCFVLFTGGIRSRTKYRTCDRHVELGYALKAGKRVCILGPRDTSFCHLPEIERYRTVKELVDGLR